MPMLLENTHRYTPEMLERPPAGGLNVVTTLKHFAITTYSLDPERLALHLPPRFEPLCVRIADGNVQALMSVVSFYDTDFRLCRLSAPRFDFGQTNYRAYIVNRETGQMSAWFFGTTLDSAAVAIPRYLWRLPWHPGRMRFACTWDADRYTHYTMNTRSKWAAMELELEDTGRPVTALDGFPDLETAQVLLTHPLVGYYYRTDGAVGSYSIWHNRLQLTKGQCLHARFDLLDRLDLVPFSSQQHPHSVLIQPQTEFTIYLPPHKST